MSINVRQRSAGAPAELRIKHKLLPKPLYLRFGTVEEARRYGAAVDATLDRGALPEGLFPHAKPAVVDIAGAIAAYERACTVKPDTAALLRNTARTVGATKLNAVDYLWAEAWVRAQKVRHVRAPGTIRHHVGALRRCFSWVVKTYPASLATNPLADLERGYSAYNESEQQALAERGLEAPEDCERNRRLDAEEERRCLGVLEAAVAAARTDTERAWAEGALLVFRLALETAMRMRELYTLDWTQVDLARRTIFLTKTKNRDDREVPLTSVAVELLERDRPRLRQHGASLVFPFWHGTRTRKALQDVSRCVSTHFAAVFDAAGCPDLTFHDLRHEAICRLVLRTTLSETELARITGHRDPRMLRRYMSLRGSELAVKLW